MAELREKDLENVNGGQTETKLGRHNIREPLTGSGKDNGYMPDDNKKLKAQNAGEYDIYWYVDGQDF